jgi:hypothetical protein
MLNCRTECKVYSSCTVGMFNMCEKRKPNRNVGKTMKKPSIYTLAKWTDEGYCKATDGCKVEPDGICTHGKKSWLLEMGII